MASTRSTVGRSGAGGPCSRCGRAETEPAAAEGELACRACGRAGAEARGSACSSPLTVGGGAPAATAANAAATAASRRELRPTANRTVRSTRFRRQTSGRTTVPKGKGRRIIFKKSAVKAPLAVSTPVTTNYVFHKGTYYQVGDIVSLVSLEGDIYYAQIRGLLQDQYCEKSAVLSWLLPTPASPPPEQQFDPSTYIIGPDEEIPRRLDCMSLVTSAPSDYFRRRHAPYPTAAARCGRSGFVYTRLGPRAVPAHRAKEFMV